MVAAGTPKRLVVPGAYLRLSSLPSSPFGSLLDHRLLRRAGKKHTTADCLTSTTDVDPRPLRHLRPAPSGGIILSSVVQEGPAGLCSSKRGRYRATECGHAPGHLRVRHELRPSILDISGEARSKLRLSRTGTRPERQDRRHEGTRHRI